MTQTRLQIVGMHSATNIDLEDKTDEQTKQ